METKSEAHKESMKRKIQLKELIDCSLEQQSRVREIRNQISVRSSMYTDHEITMNEHLQWISKLKSDLKQIVFAVLNERDLPVGVVSINSLDKSHQKSDWAFYLDESERGGLGAALEFSLLEYAFNVLGLEKLNCEVIETNEGVVKLHKKFGFSEEGFRRSNILKNGKRIGVYFLGITKDEWQAQRDEIFLNHKSTFDRFDIFICGRSTISESPLALIEQARAKNNINWMALLRLSIEQRPEIAKPIISEILKLDTEISDLTKKLI